MVKRALLVGAVLAAGCAPGPGGSTGSAKPSVTSTPTADGVPHVVLVVEENRDYSGVIGKDNAPYINQLAGDHGIALAAYGQAHPSLPNYLELVSGSTFGVSDDGTGYSFEAQTLGSQLNEKGIRWGAYMEGMPHSCYQGASSGQYAKKHNPFIYFTTVSGTAALCRNVLPYADLAQDLSSSTPPAFVWISPNLCHDGHDCSNKQMDSWLRASLEPILASQWFAQDGIAIITWDEGAEGDGSGCCSGAKGGHIATVVVSTRVQGHVESSAPVDHAGILRTIEQLYGLPLLGDAACSCSGDLSALVGEKPSP